MEKSILPEHLSNWIQCSLEFFKWELDALIYSNIHRFSLFRNATVVHTTQTQYMIYESPHMV